MPRPLRAFIDARMHSNERLRCRKLNAIVAVFFTGPAYAYFIPPKQPLAPHYPLRLTLYPNSHTSYKITYLSPQMSRVERRGLGGTTVRAVLTILTIIVDLRSLSMYGLCTDQTRHN